MKRSTLAVAAVAAAFPAHAGAWDFRTPDGSVYCRLGLPQDRLAFGCVRPSDGRWIGFSGDPYSRPRAATRVRASYGSARDRRSYVLKRGRSWSSSDATAFTCCHFRRGVTCKAFAGLSFWLGGTRGYRVFRDRPGFRPHVRPLFRTPLGVRCGIELWTLEPASPLFRCRRPRDGRELTLSPSGPGSTRLWPKSEGFRPRGFAVLHPGGAFVWRCRRVEQPFAEDCPATRGKAIFTCRLLAERLSCRNPSRRGFWVAERGFGVL